jgi:hypothetical protein
MSYFLYNDSELQTDTHFVLCIEERDTITPVDTRLFIAWNRVDKDYFVRGRREDTKKSNYVPYAFHCEKANNIYDFINFVIGDSKVNLILYNFNNIATMNVNEITYEFLEGHMDKNYEVTGYDDCKLHKKEIVRYLRFLKNAYNWENTKN